MQVPAVSLAIGVTLLAAAGCLEPNPDQPGSGPRPDDWDEGLELLAHSTGRAHSGAFDARVFPGEHEAFAVPSYCVAYRADTAFGNDKCTVMTSSSEHWFPIGDPPWGLMGAWRGREGDTADRPDPDLPRTLVAFDAAGQAVAYWDGENHPEASHSTE